MGQPRKRTYDQYCALARALEVIGERWTLLVVRELLLGPKRYKDLLEGLPGIGTNLLAQRLRELEEVGVIGRRRLPPPAGVNVYELTELGLGLEEAVLALGRWGASFLGAPRPADASRPGWYVLSMLATFRAEKTDGLAETFELRIDDQVFEVSASSEGARVEQVATARGSDAVIATDLGGFVDLLAGRLPPDEALASGRVRAEGKPGSLERFVDLFRWRDADR